MGYERNDRRPGSGYSGERGGYGGNQDRGSYGGDYGRRDEGYRGTSYGNYGGAGARDYRGDRFNDEGRRDYGRDPRGYDNDRGFFERAGDEVRSWFGDEDADRRRREDERRYETQNRYDSQGSYGSQGRYGDHYAGERGDTYNGQGSAYGAVRSDDRYGNSGASWGRERDQSERHDPSYRSWRDRQMQSFDRDYDEYRRENQSRFDTEFHSWRQGRQGQRDLLGKVQEHQEVVGSDGQHVGKVDHVRGDNIKLAKNDQDAGGHHHLIPSSWIQSVDDKITLSKTADQAKQQWRDAERNQEGGLFGGSDQNREASRPFDRAYGGNNNR